jgi:hypothetical protein
LKSKEASDRLLAAHLLILRYNYTPQRFYGAFVKAEPIDAEESKLIMQTLAEPDWSRDDPETRATPHAIGWLNLSASKAGRPLPPHLKPEEFKKWVKDSAGTYRIQKLVPVKPAEKE